VARAVTRLLVASFVAKTLLSQHRVLHSLLFFLFRAISVVGAMTAFVAATKAVGRATVTSSITCAVAVTRSVGGDGCGRTTASISCSPRIRASIDSCCSSNSSGHGSFSICATVDCSTSCGSCGRSCSRAATRLVRKRSGRSRSDSSGCGSAVRGARCSCRCIGRSCRSIGLHALIADLILRVELETDTHESFTNSIARCSIHVAALSTTVTDTAKGALGGSGDVILAQLQPVVALRHHISSLYRRRIRGSGSCSIGCCHSRGGNSCGHRCRPGRVPTPFKSVRCSLRRSSPT